MSYVTDAGELFTLPRYAEDVRDVSGAGDTVVAVCSLGIAVGLEIKETMYLASKAAAIAVSKYQSSVVYPHELLNVI